MQRNVRDLRASADRVTADLVAAVGVGWSCSVDETFVLTVTGPTETESVLLDADITDLFEPEESWPFEDQRSAREEDADDVVASEVLEVLQVLGVAGPRCPQHDEPMESCSSVWTCPAGHDGPFIGDLTNAHACGERASDVNPRGGLRD